MAGSVVRPATEADRAAMAEAQAEAYWSNIDDLAPGAHAHPGYQKRVESMAREDAEGNWRNASVGEVDGRVVGVCYIEPSPRLLEGLWVHPDFHGRGIGSTLIEDAVARFRAMGATHVMLEVHPENPALRLYLRHGFVVTEETMRHSVGLARDLPLLVMKRQLD
ncbi:MAG: GNAT family N-acetyltransferase [Rhizobiaceae bacterium]|jgi:ribosomal protein S18 acetylase RimI-like enzyme|nr:GNAT family N-acetyltransferase [Rhizobiaceae bacterium]